MSVEHESGHGWWAPTDWRAAGEALEGALHGAGAGAGPPPAIDGYLRLVFGRAPWEERTRLLVQEQRAPLQVVRAFPAAGGAALVHLHNLSGGVLGGDRYAVEVSAGPQTRVLLTSTGATRLYRCRPGTAAARQSWRVQVARGALLEYLPDPLIPFAGARYCQETQIVLAEGAGLFWWETLAPGRLARGECFAYDLVQLSLSIVAPDGPIAIERFRLEPGRRSPLSAGRLAGYPWCTSCYLCHTGLAPARWLALEERLSELARSQSEPGVTLWGVSALRAHGLLVRGLSYQGRAISAGLLAFWGLAKELLYGERAVLPRKLS